MARGMHLICRCHWNIVDFPASHNSSCANTFRHLNASLRHDETNGALVTNGSVVGFPPRRQAYSCINMNGKEVFRFAVRCVPLSIEAALQKAGLSVSNIDWLLLHQVLLSWGCHLWFIFINTSSL